MADSKSNKGSALTLSRILDHTQIDLYRTYIGHTRDINDITFHPLRPWILSAAGDKTCRIWEISPELDGKQNNSSKDAALEIRESIVLTGHSLYVNKCVVSVRHEVLYTASTDSTIRVWDLDKHTCIGVMKGHSNVIQTLTLSPNESLLVSGSSDTNIKLWDPQKRTCLKTLSGQDSSVTSCTFSHDGIAFVSSGSNGEILCWDLSASKVTTRTTAHPDVGTNICVFSPIVRPKNYLLATGGNDNLFKLWNLKLIGSKAEFSPIWSIDAHGSSVFTLAFSPDGSILVSGGGDSSIMFWDVNTKEQLLTIQPHDKYVTCVKFSPDSNLLATGAYDGIVKVWKLAMNVPDKLLAKDLKLESPDFYNDVPTDFICPISLQIMLEPVIAADGYNYDRCSILMWLHSSKCSPPRSPLTNLPLPSTELTLNVDLQQKIHSFLNSS